MNYGILSQVKITFDAIEYIELSSKGIKQDKGVIKLSTLGDLESLNIIIHLSFEHELTGFLWKKKKIYQYCD